MLTAHEVALVWASWQFVAAALSAVMQLPPGDTRMGKNADIVKGLYAAFAKGDMPAVLGAFDPGIQWNEAENFLYAGGNPYVGPQAVAEGVFSPSALTSMGLR